MTSLGQFMRLTFSLRMIIDFLSDQLTVTFIGISSPPWNKDDDVHLSGMSFPDTVAPSCYAYQIYPFNSLELYPTTTRPIFPGIFAEPEISNLSQGLFFSLSDCYYVSNKSLLKFLIHVAAT